MDEGEVDVGAAISATGLLNDAVGIGDEVAELMHALRALDEHVRALDEHLRSRGHPDMRVGAELLVIGRSGQRAGVEHLHEIAHVALSLIERIVQIIDCATIV